LTKKPLRVPVQSKTVGKIVLFSDATPRFPDGTWQESIFIVRSCLKQILIVITSFSPQRRDIEIIT